LGYKNKQMILTQTAANCWYGLLGKARAFGGKLSLKRLKFASFYGAAHAGHQDLVVVQIVYGV
jgi:hypothetical protein